MYKMNIKLNLIFFFLNLARKIKTDFPSLAFTKMRCLVYIDTTLTGVKEVTEELFCALSPALCAAYQEM